MSKFEPSIILNLIPISWLFLNLYHLLFANLNCWMVIGPPSLLWIGKFEQNSFISCLKNVLHSCNKIDTTLIQISRQNQNDFYSNINYQMMIQLTSIVCRSKNKWYRHQKLKIFVLDSQSQTNQILRCTDADYVSFLFYYYCTFVTYYIF